MLKLNLDPTFTESVEITVPGQKKTGKINLTFKYRTRSEMLEFSEAAKGKKDLELIKEIVVGWSGIDEDFSEENLEVFLDNYPASPLEISTAYNRLLLESRIKN